MLHVDEHVVVINKPSGLLVHRSPIDRHETRFAVQLLRDQLGTRVYPVHRLDKGTSGALAFGLDRESASALARAFASGAVAKTYLAVVRNTNTGLAPEQAAAGHGAGHAPAAAEPAGRSH